MSTYTHLFDLPGFDYEKILRYAKKIDYSNYMDLAHDHILTGKSMQTLKFYYKTVNEIVNFLQKSGQISLPPYAAILNLLIIS